MSGALVLTGGRGHHLKVALPVRCCSLGLSLWPPQDSLDFLTARWLGYRRVNVGLPGLRRLSVPSPAFCCSEQSQGQCGPKDRGEAAPSGIGNGLSSLRMGGQADSLVFRQMTRWSTQDVGLRRAFPLLPVQAGVSDSRGGVGNTGFQDTFVFNWMNLLLSCSEDWYNS